MSELLTVQPPPVNEAEDNPAVWESVQAHLPLSLNPLTAGVIRDMVARDALGRERYGVPLTVWNGRDALADAYQEALDLVVYLEQCRLRVPAPVEPWAPCHPHDRLTSLRNEVVGIVVELAKLRGQVPVQRFIAHAGSPEVVP